MAFTSILVPQFNFGALTFIAWTDNPRGAEMHGHEFQCIVRLTFHAHVVNNKIDHHLSLSVIWNCGH